MSDVARMKRSRRIALTTLMASAGVTLAACGQDATPATATWNDRPVQIEQGKPVPAFTYASLQACKDANEVPDTVCEDAVKSAVADQDKAAPRFGDQQTCEERFGVGQCVPGNQAGGGSFFTPLLTGFIVGQMLNGGFRGTGLYRDQRDGGLYTGYGGRVDTDYATGRTRIGANGIDPPASIKSTPPRIQTRTSVLSRGGFGGRMGGYGFGG